MPALRLTRACPCRGAACTDLQRATAGELDALSGFLASHDVFARTRLLRARRNADIGEVLLGHARSSGADFLVLGGFGHSRLRELVLGSVSTTVLRDLPVPALFAH